MKVYEGLAKAFQAEGTTAVFGMMGDGNMYWMEALDRLGVRLLEVRHEGAGLGMADGWARATHTPGIATATCGPGVTQLATALVTAARANSPLVAFCGESPTADEEYNQRFDQSRFAEACETGFVRVLSPETAYDAVRKAFYQARLESRPIMLSAPMDTQQKTMDDDLEYVPSTSLLGDSRVWPPADAIARAADLIGAAKMPVIIAGRGAMWSGPSARAAIVELAEQTNALLATSLMAKGWFGSEEYCAGISGLYATRTAMELFAEADLVIAFGASLNRYTTEQGYLYPDAKYIQVDVKPHVLMGGGRPANVYIQADAALAASALSDSLSVREYAPSGSGYRTADVRSKLAGQYEDKTRFELEPGTVDPREVCRILDDIIPNDVNLVGGSGASAGFTTMLINKPRPLALAGHWFGCIGQMLPAAMGAAVATGRPTMVCDGDASIIMHLAELETAVRCGIDLMVVVLNDEALGSEYHKMRSHDMKYELSTVPNPDLGAVGVALGGRGRLARSLDDVRAAAQDWVAHRGVMVLDARISRNVITIPYRRLHYGRDE
ncbi:MAG TPA: thiamine pyrophosphate-binding protein [Chloroflexota bacterium]|nr:thiamine pyrophosphate-binding protein [Chloroflexota bacterium]